MSASGAAPESDAAPHGAGPDRADAPRAGERGAIWSRLPYLRATLTASAALLLVAVPVGGLLRGGTGAAGAAAGIALVVVSYLISGVSVAWADAVNPRLIMSVGLVTYATKIVVLGVAMAVIAATGWAGLAPMGASTIAAVIVWTVTHLVWAVRSPLPVVRPNGE
jgi:ATP synthase protein I